MTRREPEYIEGWHRVVLWTTEPEAQGCITGVLDRLGTQYKCFRHFPVVGQSYKCANLRNWDDTHIQELRAKVLRIVEPREVRSLLRMRPDSKLRLQRGVWCEIHAD